MRFGSNSLSSQTLPRIVLCECPVQFQPALLDMQRCDPSYIRDCLPILAMPQSDCVLSRALEPEKQMYLQLHSHRLPLLLWLAPVEAVLFDLLKMVCLLLSNLSSISRVARFCRSAEKFPVLCVGSLWCNNSCLKTDIRCFPRAAFCEVVAISQFLNLSASLLMMRVGCGRHGWFANWRIGEWRIWRPHQLQQSRPPPLLGTASRHFQLGPKKCWKNIWVFFQRQTDSLSPIRQLANQPCRHLWAIRSPIRQKRQFRQLAKQPCRPGRGLKKRLDFLMDCSA